MRKQTSFTDIKKLSAYLDKQLSRAEQARLEARLSERPDLHEILVDLRQARTLLQKTPLQRVPRNFTLTPKMVGMRPPVPRSVPVFRLATITAAVLLFISFTFNYLTPFASAPSLAAAPQFSQSGGGCGYDDPADCGDVAMEAVPFGIGGGAPETATPEELAAMAAAPEALDATSADTTLEATPEADQRTMQQPTQVANNTSPDLPALDPLPSEKSQAQPQPFVSTFQMGLVLLVIICGSSAFLIRQISIQRWRKRL